MGRRDSDLEEEINEEEEEEMEECENTCAGMTAETEYNRLLMLMAECDPVKDTQRYNALSIAVEHLSKSIEHEQAAMTEYGRRRNEARAREIDEENLRINERNQYAWVWQLGANLISNLGGQLVGQMINRKNVKTITKYEDDGNIVSSKATMFLTKPRQ